MFEFSYKLRRGSSKLRALLERAEVGSSHLSPGTRFLLTSSDSSGRVSSGGQHEEQECFGSGAGTEVRRIQQHQALRKVVNKEVIIPKSSNG